MKKIIPVIHVLDFEQVKKNVEICVSRKIDSVFLINHNVEPDELVIIGAQIHKLYPDLNIGFNLLGFTPFEAIKFVPSFTKMLWSDNTEIKYGNNLIGPDTVYDLCKKKNIMYFGGTAFKYQYVPNEEELEWVCLKSKDRLDVVTTSGPRTGMPASLKKIETIKNHIGDFPLALASGVSWENIASYENLVDYFLVATSITGKGEMIVPEELDKLIANLSTAFNA